MRKIFVALMVAALVFGCASKPVGRKENKPADFTIFKSPFDIDKFDPLPVWGESLASVQKKLPEFQCRDNTLIMSIWYSFSSYDILFGISYDFDQVEGLYRVQHSVMFFLDENISNTHLSAFNSHFDKIYSYYYNALKASLSADYTEETVFNNSEVWVLWSKNVYNAASITQEVDKSDLTVVWYGPILYYKPQIFYPFYR